MQLNTPLPIESIDFRIQSINKGGYATILAYKDARVDMNRLDAVYGPGFWQKKYETIDGNLYCSVGVWNKELNQWIWVQDVGTESFTEKEKGQASDAFKRACFNLGIGRELYEYPLIQVKLNQNEFALENGKARQTYELKLRDWKWQSDFKDNKIVMLKAVDEKGNQRFLWKDGQVPASPQQTPSAQPQAATSNETPTEKPWLNPGPQYNAVTKRLREGTTTIEQVKEHYRVSKTTEDSLQQIVKEQTQNA